MNATHDVSAALLEITRTLKPDDPRDRLLERLAARVVEIVPDADAASVTLYDKDVPATVAATEPSILPLDKAQYSADDGPCLRAVRSETVVRTELARNRLRWPELVDVALKQEIHTSLSCPLFVPDDDRAAHVLAREYGLAGALNVWSKQERAFDPLETALIAMFTSAAAAVILTAERWTRAEAQAHSLLAALESRDAIATAKGIVMAHLNLTSDAAFQRLTEISQLANRKVRDLATMIVADPDLVTLLRQ